MTSKQVVDRARSSASVMATMEAHSPELVEQLAARLSPHLHRGEVMPDVALLVSLASRHLAHAAAQLDVADRTHEAELSDDAAPRAERDAAHGSLRVVVTDMKGAIQAVGGAAAQQALGISGAVPTDVRALERFAAGLHDALLDTSRVVTSTSRVGLVLDRPAMAAVLAPEIARLQRALEHVAKEAAELGLTQTAKDKAIEKNDATFSGVANAMQGLLILAGRADLADRVRPSKRRPGTVEVEEAPEV